MKHAHAYPPSPEERHAQNVELTRQLHAMPMRPTSQGSPMEQYQQRVVDEKTELDTKSEKLHAFISSPAYAALEMIDRHLLLDQLQVMDTYSSVLAKRIARFAATA